MKSTRLLLTLCLAYAAFIVYGSLVPWDYKAMPFDQAWQAFRQIPFLKLGIESRADWVANGVLYLPLGYLSATWLIRSLPRVWMLPALALAVLGCCGLAVAVEFTQLFFPPRTVSLNDLMAEAIGSLSGATVAPVLLPWLKRFQAHWHFGGQSLGRHLLALYGVFYLFLCFFPYDLLLSVSELQGKMASGLWGWWLTPDGPSLLRAVLQLGLEVALAAPFGLMWARRGRGASLASAALLGLMLGLLIELGQFLIASGMSQGASVLSRSLGCIMGVMLWQWRDRLGLSALAAMLRRWALPIAALYALGLAEVNGWFAHAWHGPVGVAQHWAELNLLPFYYHYYTTEALALFSLSSVSLMYLPVAALVWAFGGSARRSALCVALTALLMECSKLFLSEGHADPTNILIATVACALARYLLDLSSQSASARPDPISALETTGAAPLPANTRLPQALLLGLGLLLALGTAARFPAAPLWLSLGLLVSAAVVWRWPVLALALIPAALPILDLAPWSGRFYWDEFDLLLLVCLSVGIYRSAPVQRRSPDLLTASFALLGLSLLLSCGVALWPLSVPDANSFSAYTSVFNALRIVKGALWAWGFVLLYRRLAVQGDTRRELFGAGMQIGLLLTVLFVIWERAAFVGLLDFTSDYRVTGPFSAMHKGGAYIECYLALACAFVLSALLQARSWAGRLWGASLLLLAAYALTVTYSRNGYAALLVVLLVCGLGTWLAGRSRASEAPGGRRTALALLVGVLVLGVVLPILGGSYARERLAQSSGDLRVRQDHWADALAMRDPGLRSALLGMGVGRFPDLHFWRSAEPQHASTYRLERDADGQRFLRLGAGAALYIEQIVALEPGVDHYTLQAQVRSSQAKGEASVALCQKWMLTSARCQFLPLRSGDTAGQWQTISLQIPTAALTDQTGWARKPLKLALVTPSEKLQFDIKALRLEAPGTARDLGNQLRNGAFDQGMDHWFFTTDLDPPWHIHSLPVAVLFDQGWLGVLAWGLVLGSALAMGWRAVWRGQVGVVPTLAALLGFLVSGSLNTLIDAPRFVWLLLVLAWLCRGTAAGGNPVHAKAPATRA